VVGSPALVAVAPFFVAADSINRLFGDVVLQQLVRPSAGLDSPYGCLTEVDPHPSAVACVTSDLASLTVHLRFPTEHWHRIRHSNLIERTFGETRRRTKVIGRLPGEASCLSLVWAVLDRASRGWRGLTMTPKALRLLQDLRRQLLHPTAAEGVIDEAVTAAA
jgi:Transposase, Mutator family